MNRVRLSFALILITIFVAGCTPSPKVPPRTAIPAQDSIVALLRAAEESPPIRAAELRVEAARRLVDQGRHEDAVAALDQVDTRSLPPSLAFEVSRLRASSSLERQDGSRALQYLDWAQLPPSMDPAQAVELAELRADAYEQQDDPLSALRELIISSQLEIDHSTRLYLHERIWRELTQLNPSLLDSAVRDQRNGYHEQGWFELAQTMASRRDHTGQMEALEQWQILWQGHPAAIEPPQLLTGMQPSPSMALLPTPAQHGGRIGLLLPFSGQLSQAATNISEGFITAMQTQGAGFPQPHLLMLDSAQISTPEQLFAVAQQQQLNLIIGPLDRSFVNAIAQQPFHPVPVLALNQADPGPSMPYQLDLSSEQEAIEVAERAFRDGHRSILTITPNAAWGDRLERTFIRHFESLGGRVAGSLRADTSANLSGQISSLVATDPRQQSSIALRIRQGEKIEPEERRRQDVDAILLAASPQDARQIQPMLAYHYAGDIPIYATSHLYDGQPDRTRDTDLNNIQFTDLPWRIREPSPTHQAMRAARTSLYDDLGKLYALGADAYTLFPYLQQLASTPGSYIEGETGRLSLDQQNRIVRTLPWAKFSNGIPQPLDY